MKKTTFFLAVLLVSFLFIGCKSVNETQLDGSDSIMSVPKNATTTPQETDASALLMDYYWVYAHTGKHNKDRSLLSDANDQIEDLENELKKMNDEYLAKIAALEKALAKAQANSSDSDNSNDNSEYLAEIETLQMQIDLLRKRIKDLEGLCQTKDNEIAKQKQQIELLQKENKDLEAEIARLNALLKNANNQQNEPKKLGALAYIMFILILLAAAAICYFCIYLKKKHK